jgi:hypothetical protein
MAASFISIKPMMSGFGPLSPLAAFDRHGSYQEVSCRQHRCGATGEDAE